MFDRFYSLNRHHDKHHGSKVSFRRWLLAAARYHRCWECRRILLCDKEVRMGVSARIFKAKRLTCPSQVIRHHAVTHHTMTMPDYCRRAEEEEEKRRKGLGEGGGGFKFKWVREEKK